MTSASSREWPFGINRDQVTFLNPISIWTAWSGIISRHPVSSFLMVSKSGKQHVEINRKLWLRRQLYSRANPSGAAYLPFCGDGDLATFYQDHTVYAADLDAKRIEIFRARYPSATAVVTDVETWPFPDVTVRFSVADFDAYGNPYRAFRAFWEHAHKIYPLVCIFTGGLRQRIQRGDVIWDFNNQKSRPSISLTEARKQYNFWLKQHCIPWLAKVIAPCTIILIKFCIRRFMVYWGCVIADKPGKQGTNNVLEKGRIRQPKGET